MITTAGRGVGHYQMRWDGLTWDTWTDPTTGESEPLSIGRVLSEMRGVRGVTIERADGTVVLRNAGGIGPRFVSDMPTVRAHRVAMNAKLGSWRLTDDAAAHTPHEWLRLAVACRRELAQRAGIGV